MAEEEKKAQDEATQDSDNQNVSMNETSDSKTEKDVREREFPVYQETPSSYNDLLLYLFL